MRAPSVFGLVWPPLDAEHWLVSAEQMLALEQEWLGSGLPVAALMEAVGQAMAEWCLQRPKRLEQGVLVLVGPGHNGGDGLVVARRLLHAGVEVRLWAPLPLCQALTQTHWRHLEWLGTSVLKTDPDPRDSGLWVEALFGLGQHRPLPEGLALLLSERERVQPGRLISLDVPAGMHSNHGRVEAGGGAVASDTLCVGLVKRGLVQDAAMANVGRVHRLDPGVPSQLIEQLRPAAVLRVMAKDLATLPVPQDAPTAMKYQRGRVLLVAGSERYRGAALLAAQGAMASGVGSLRAALPEAVAEAIWQWIPELVLSAGLPATASGGLAWGPWLADADLSRLDALLLGPGLGALDGQWDAWAEPLVSFEGLLVLDADGLNALAASKHGWRWLCEREFPTWITPHPSEFARLFPDFSRLERLESTQSAAAGSGAVVLLKGAHSVIADPNGVVHQLVDTSAQVARTGLGDLLAGFAVGWGARCWACGEEPRGTDLAAAALLHAEASQTSEDATSASEIGKTLSALTRQICAN